MTHFDRVEVLMKEENIPLVNHCSRTNLNVYDGFIIRSNKRFVSLPVLVIQLEFTCSKKRSGSIQQTL